MLTLLAAVCLVGSILGTAILATLFPREGTADRVAQLVLALAWCAGDLLNHHLWIVGGLWVLVALLGDRALRVHRARAWSIAALLIIANGAVEFAGSFVAGSPTAFAIVGSWLWGWMWLIELLWLAAQFVVVEAIVRTGAIVAAPRRLVVAARFSQALLVVHLVLLVVQLSMRTPARGLGWLMWAEWAAGVATTIAVARTGLSLAGALRRMRPTWPFREKERANARCVRCGHPLAGQAVEATACPECGLPSAANVELHLTEPLTIASPAWRRCVRGASVLLLLSLAGSMLLCIAQAVESTYPLVGWHALGGGGSAIRLGLHAMLALAFLQLLRAHAVRALALTLLLALTVDIVVGWIDMTSRPAFTIRGVMPLTSLAALGVAAQSLVGVGIAVLLVVLANRASARSVVALAMATLVAFGPLVVVALARFRWGGSSWFAFHAEELRRVLLGVDQWAPWLPVVGRHLWEIPALVGICLLMRRVRRPWEACAPQPETTG
ncbi:MAG: hypothetical protein JNL94_12850 [Planctomycetes bacterium]|nr:hypothetical protein [Planctomycetota bacterium]